MAVVPNSYFFFSIQLWRLWSRPNMTRRIRRLKVTLANAAALSLTSDMWTSNNMDSYLAVRCHYIWSLMVPPTWLLVAKHWGLRHAICMAYILNLIVKKALDSTPVLSAIRTKARRPVRYFRSSTTAKVGSLTLLSYLLMYYLLLLHSSQLFVFLKEKLALTRADGEASAKANPGGRH